MKASPPRHFADRLTLASRRLGHPLCVGLDPHLDRIPALFGPPRDAATVERFLRAVLDRIAGRVVVVKPQIAFFEALGPPGIEVLARVVRAARELGLLVLLDAKRGDIGSTARAYADAYLAPGAPFEVDAITLNPYLGGDSLAPFVEAAERGGRGLFVLVKTSNPGGADLQDRRLEGSDGDTDGKALFEATATLLADAAARLTGPETGWSSLGVVVGATWPEAFDRVRAILPTSPFLVPGYGAQGGRAVDAVRGFVAGPDGRLEGGLVNASRAVLFPAGAAEARSAADWQRAIDAAVDHAVDELGAAIAD